MTRSRYALPIFIMMLVLLVAAGLRLHNLDGPSFWYDEGVAYGHATRSLGELVPRLRDNVHVPAYFGSLTLYEDIVGNSEFALRSLSVWFSLISVAAAYALARRLFGTLAGISAAILVTFNSFSIYYAQETRMYAMLAAIATLSMWVFVGMVKRLSHNNLSPERNRDVIGWGIALAVLNIIGEYIHVSYALVMLVQGGLALVWFAILLPKNRAVLLRAFIVYFAANLVTVLLFLPWLGTALSQVGAQPNISDTMPMSDFLRLVFGRFVFGLSFDTTMGGMGIIVFVLLIFALLSIDDKHPLLGWRVAMPVIWVILSVALYGYLGLYDRYFRFLLPVQIATAIWISGGIETLWRIVSPDKEEWRQLVGKAGAVASLIAIMIVQLQGLPLLYSEDLPLNFVRDDYRSLAQQIATETDSNDAIILSAPGQQEIFGYYYDGEAPVYPLPVNDNPQADVEEILANSERVYVVAYGAAEQDPNGTIFDTLNNKAFQINAEWFDNVQLFRYAASATFDDVQTVDMQFGDNIMLVDYALSSDTLAPNDALQVQLTWQTDRSLETRYKVFLQLLDADGVLAIQRDSEPAGGQAITTIWDEDTPIMDNHALAIPADLTSGEYTLIIGLYPIDDAANRLPVGDSDFYILGTVTVTD